MFLLQSPDLGQFLWVTILNCEDVTDELAKHTGAVQPCCLSSACGSGGACMGLKIFCLNLSHCLDCVCVFVRKHMNACVTGVFACVHGGRACVGVSETVWGSA